MPETTEYRLSRLEEDFARFDAQNSKTHQKFHDKFEAVAIQNSNHTNHYETIMSSIGKLEVKVDSLAAQPAKKWDKVTSAAIAAIVTGIIGIIIGAVFGGG